MKLLKVNGIYYDVDKYYAIRYRNWSFFVTYDYCYHERNRRNVPKEYAIPIEEYCFKDIEPKLSDLLHNWLASDEKILDIDKWYEENSLTLDINYGTL